MGTKKFGHHRIIFFALLRPSSPPATPSPERSSFPESSPSLPPPASPMEERLNVGSMLMKPEHTSPPAVVSTLRPTLQKLKNLQNGGRNNEGDEVADEEESRHGSASVKPS